MILAGIDIGTNTLRLLIAATGPRSFTEIHSDRKITRLGASLDRTGLLSGAGRARSLEALEEFSAEIKKAGCSAVEAVGTSALRRASDSAEFLAEVKERTGIVVRVIDGLEEARLTLLGIERALGKQTLAPHAMVIDIGGGSTEIIGRSPFFAQSVHLGAVYLTERFLTHDPPLPDEVGRLRAEVRSALRSELPSSLRPGSLIGTAGTVTTLAAMYHRLESYDPDRINGSQLTGAWISETIERLSGNTLEERRAIAGLEPGREDIILAGALILQEVMEQWRLPELTVSDWGLREGILFDRYDRMRAEA